MKITIKVKNTYGIDLAYPVCETALQLAKLSGKKTLTHDALNIIKQLGYTIHIEKPTFAGIEQ